jgi:hypothetical protein
MPMQSVITEINSAARRADRVTRRIIRARGMTVPRPGRVMPGHPARRDRPRMKISASIPPVAV